MDKILIIEDDELIRENLIELFTNEGYLVFASENGKKGLEKAFEIVPDIIVSDIMMPEMDGFQVYKSIRSEPLLSVIPFIFLSALSERLHIRSGMVLGADDYITKPFINTELLEAVKNRIQKSKAAKKSMEELKFNLIRSVPHEFLTPLNAVLGFSQLLLDGCNEEEFLSKEDIHDYAFYIHDAGEKLLRITKNYVLFTELSIKQKTSEHRDRIKNEIYQNISKEIPELLFQFAKSENRENDLELKIENANLFFSKKGLNKILEEILNNAMKFSRMKTKIIINGFIKDNYYYLTIQDFGRGMSLEEIQRIESFVQFEREVSEQSGLGLGLALVKKLVDIDQGEFWLESEKDKGTIAKLKIGLYEND